MANKNRDENMSINRNMNNSMNNNMGENVSDEMIKDILKHLDSELEKGAVRMSVIMDENSKVAKEVSHICCNSYGRPANETVGLLDMYTDRNAGEPDRQDRRG